MASIIFQICSRAILEEETYMNPNYMLCILNSFMHAHTHIQYRTFHQHQSIITRQKSEHYILISTTTARLLLESALTGANAAIAKTIEKRNHQSIAFACAHVIVSFKKHVIQVNHGSQNVGLLLRGYGCRVERHFVNVGIGKGFTKRSPKAVGLDFSDTGKVAERQCVNLRHCHSSPRNRNSEPRIDAKFGTASKETRTTCCGKHFRFSRITTIHNLHDRLEVASTDGLDGLTNHVGHVPAGSLGFSGHSSNITGMECGTISTSWLAGEATKTGLGTRTGKATITSFSFHCHDRSANHFSRCAIDVVEFSKQ